MSEFEDLEGPRRNEREIYVVESDSGAFLALTSRVEARSMSKNGYTSHGSIELEDGEAHIGDKVWCVLSHTNEPKATYLDEADARQEKTDSDNIVGISVRHWDVTKQKTYRKDRLEELREKGIK